MARNRAVIGGIIATVCSLIITGFDFSGSEDLKSSAMIAFERDGVWIANVYGSNQRMLAEGTHPEISPDGSKVAFTKYGDSLIIRYIAVIDVATREERILSSIAGSNSVGSSWSPDGQKLLFMTLPGHPPDWQIGFVNVDDTGYRLLTPKGVTISNIGLFSPCWGRDGTSVICQDFDSLWEFNLDGTLISQVAMEKIIGSESDSLA